MPAAERAGYEHAKATIPGSFVDEHDSSNNLTLSVSEDRPGVSLDKVWVDGLDYRSIITSYRTPLTPEMLANLSTPMGSTGLASSPDESSCQRVQYRATPNQLPSVFPRTRAAAAGGVGLFDDVCSQPWLTTRFFNHPTGTKYVSQGLTWAAGLSCVARDVKQSLA